MIGVRGNVLNHTYIPAGIKCELQPEGASCQDCLGRISEHSFSWTTISNFSHIEGFTLGEGKEICEVSGRAIDLVLGGIGKVDGRTSEGQGAGVYRTGFTVGSHVGRGWGTSVVW